jgi:TonB-linked SusC/RagA family outer membrane protein
MFSSLLLHAQERTITGTVTDETGALPGVSIIIKGTTTGTETDFDGKYSIKTTTGDVLVFSFVGMTTQERTVGNTAIINVVMEADNILEEVVVVGYGSKSRKLTTSAISTVSSEQIEAFVPSTSLDNMLQGQAAGVQVTAQNGRPGAVAFVQIRGIGSIGSSTTPLYVIDGIPMDAADVNNINPSDIASFSILKDAATISKFGSRGANGVIVITTKQGRPGEAKIILRNSVGYASRTKDPFDLMNATQKLEIERQFAALGVNAAQSLPGATSTPAQLAILQSLDTNWEEELLRDAFIQSSSLSISGGDERLTYFLSMGYDKNSGIIDRIDGFERINMRINTTYKAKDWLTVGANISLARNTTDLPRDRFNVQNPFVGMYEYNPYEPLFLRDTQGVIVTDASGEPIFNPTSTGFPIARALTTEPSDSRNFLIIGSLFADIKFSDKFSNRFSVGGTNNRNNQTQRVISGGVLDGFIGVAGMPGSQSDFFSVDFEYNVNNLFTYTDTFNDVHNVTASFLIEFTENIFTDLNASAQGFPSPDFPFLDVAAMATAAGSREIRNSLFSQGLFVDYDYDGKYIVSGSIRRDGSARFGPNNKFGYFYSGSAAWNISSEAFMDDSKFNNLKLRVSYGTSGNQSIANNTFLSLLNFNTFNGNTTAIPVGVGNPDIQWESQKILDIGVEFGLFNNRINGVVDYFKKNSEDLILPRPISQTVGDENNSITSNIGEVENTGLEVSLNIDVVKNENLTWAVGGNIVFLDNKVISLVGGQDINQGGTILREGEEINSHFITRYAGVNPANGEPLYLDADGNVTNQFSSSFDVLLKDKSPAANLEGGFYTSFKYKGFGLRGDFVFKAGNYIYNQQRQEGLEIGNINQNLRTEAFNYWKQPGDVNVLPNPLFQSTADQSSTRWLEKGDYIRLRTLTLDYTVPSKFLEKLFFNSIRVFASGQNLLTITKYNGDPEIGLGSAENSNPTNAGFVAGEFSLFSYPQTKSYTFGLEIGF